ncbi:hypothetical protein FRB90_000647 [Tulasnella sp. 427]|nr:hypothetical protein FRB90_000647 [Tulasnella sp. 427]
MKCEDRNKVFRLIQHAITLTPAPPTTSLKDSDIRSILKSEQAVLLRDDETNRYWALEPKTRKDVTKIRLSSQSNGRYTCDDVGVDPRDPGEQSRLAHQLANWLQGNDLGSSESNLLASPRATPEVENGPEEVGQQGQSSNSSASGSIIGSEVRAEQNTHRSSSPPSRKKTRLSASPEPSTVPGPVVPPSPSPTASDVVVSPSSPPTAPKPDPTPSASLPPLEAASTKSLPVPPPTSERAVQAVPPPGHHSLDDLPFETLAGIARYHLAKLQDPAAYVQALSSFFRLSPYSRDVTARLKDIWKIVHPTCSPNFTAYILQRSDGPISVCYSPRPNPTKSWQDFPQFLALVQSQGHRWRLVEVEVDPEDFGVLVDALEGSLPLLSSLSISVTPAPWSHTLSSLALPMQPSVRAQIGRAFHLLQGRTQELRHFDLQNGPVRLNPNIFLNIVTLHLSDGIHVTYGEFLSWFNVGARHLEMLYLSHLNWLDTLYPPAPNKDQAFLLGRLRDLTLIEETEDTGIINILYYIAIPNCTVLQLQSVSSHDFAGTRLARKLAPILERTLTAQLWTSLNIIGKPTSTEVSWIGGDNLEDEDELGAGFHIVCTDPNEPELPDEFFNFIRQVSERVMHRPTVSLTINDSLSGKRRPTADSDELFLPSDYFRHIDVTDIWAKIFQGHLKHLSDFLTKEIPHGLGVEATFPHLLSVHLQYLPDGSQSSKSAELSLKALVKNLHQV